jgi:predicted site-specific integrase-resolvase
VEIKQFYSRRETLAILAIGHTALERWTASGEIKSVKSGTNRIYPITEIQRLIGPRRWEEEIVNTPPIAVPVQGKRNRVREER